MSSEDVGGDTKSKFVFKPNQIKKGGIRGIFVAAFCSKRLIKVAIGKNNFPSQLA